MWDGERQCLTIHQIPQRQLTNNSNEKNIGKPEEEEKKEEEDKE